jgi:hypothetical protein
MGAAGCGRLAATTFFLVRPHAGLSLISATRLAIFPCAAGHLFGIAILSHGTHARLAILCIRGGHFVAAGGLGFGIWSGALWCPCGCCGLSPGGNG